MDTVEHMIMLGLSNKTLMNGLIIPRVKVIYKKYAAYEKALKAVSNSYKSKFYTDI